MIPYDDLVAALQAWRARMGLPVAASASDPRSAPVPAASATPGSGPRTAPPVPRTNPPAPPSGKTRAPLPLEAPEDSLEVEDAAMIDESAYENEGADFAMGFGNNGGGHDHESTEIGGAPERPSERTDPAGPRGNRDDW